ncbi:MAG TPA: hypothetical protein VI434_02970 [Candidatus Dormibacteraeota bacterium]
MTMTTTNVEILRQGWLDAASALAPGLETLPEFLENGLDAAVVDERLDEQSLLRVVTDVTSAAADSLPAEELYFLTRRLQRAVYEYLLSLDALPEPPQRRDGTNGHAAADTTLIGAEEVAALSRNGVVKVKGDPAHALETIARPVQELELAEPEHAEPEHVHPDPEPASVSDTVEAGLAQLDAQLSPEDDEPMAMDEPEAVATVDVVAEPEVAADPEAAAETASEPSTRPAFTLFRRTGAKTPQPAVESNGHAQTEATEADATAAEPATKSNGSAPNGAATPTATPEAEGEEPFVAPRDGFHLNDLADFAVVQRTAAAEATAEAAAPLEVEPVEETEPEAVAEVVAEPASVADAVPVQPEAAAAAAATDAPNGAAARGWRLRDDDADQTQDASADRSAEDDRFETDPEVVEARLEINDRLRRRRCDEAAALLQRLANDVGGRALAELALDAGDRCRALGKGNAALSCYLAASRADPVHETPLLRLADICIDDHDIDLAVSYLERVTRLRRLRNDDKGALKLYRKIVTIAPYRDDILAMLMRAQANGRFDE